MRLFVPFLLVSAVFSHISVRASTLDRFNGGWGRELGRLAKDLDPGRDYVSWLIEMPKQPIDLRSAEYFRRSIIPVYNLAAMRKGEESISHMMVAWQCHDSRGKMFRGGTAMTGEEDGQTQAMLLDGFGLSAFFAHFTDGNLYENGDIDDTVSEISKSSMPMAHVTFEVSREDCKSLQSFLLSYVNHPAHPERNFGVHLKPLKFEGAGCGSFAGALLTKAGVLPSIQNGLWRRIRGTLDLMGYGMELPAKTVLDLPSSVTRHPSSVFVNYLAAMPWTANDGPALDVVDPELGLLALKTLAEFYPTPPDVLARRRGLDASAYAPRTITSFHQDDRPTWDYIQITPAYDAQARAVVGGVRREFAAWKRAGAKIRPVAIGSYLGYLIEKSAP